MVITKSMLDEFDRQIGVQSNLRYGQAFSLYFRLHKINDKEFASRIWECKTKDELLKSVKVDFNQ